MGNSGSGDVSQPTAPPAAVPGVARVWVRRPGGPVEVREVSVTAGTLDVDLATVLGLGGEFAVERVAFGPARPRITIGDLG